MPKPNPELNQKVADILFDHWDPIGINDSPKAPRDEYKTYAPFILMVVQGGASDHEVAETLSLCASANMEIEQSIEGNLDVARRLKQEVTG